MSNSLNGKFQVLTIDSGGEGFYDPGTVVNLEADSAPTGLMFDAWTGDVTNVADINSATTTLTMPSNDVRLVAVYEPLDGIMGFFSGGQAAALSDRIEAVDFTTSDCDSGWGLIGQARVYAVGFNSTTAGYVSGGYITSNVSTVNSCDFATSTVTLDWGSLSVGVHASAGFNSSTHGYTSRGYTSTYYDRVTAHEFSSTTRTANWAT